MEPIKCLGVWMDHSNANLINNMEGVETQTIISEFIYQKKVEALNRRESGIHRKEAKKQTQFYKNIGEEIIKYDKVLLFGPTNAKLELLNYLLEDFHFKYIGLQIQSTDKMTENQQIALVKAHFLTNRSKKMYKW